MVPTCHCLLQFPDKRRVHVIIIIGNIQHNNAGSEIGTVVTTDVGCMLVLHEYNMSSPLHALPRQTIVSIVEKTTSAVGLHNLFIEQTKRVCWCIRKL